MLLVLGVILILAISAFYIYNKVNYNAKVHTEYEMVIYSHQVYNKYYTPQYIQFSKEGKPVNQNDMLTFYKMEKIIPDNAKSGAEENGALYLKFKNSFAGLMTIYNSSVVTSHIPVEVCELLGNSWNTYAGWNGNEVKKCSRIIKDMKSSDPSKKMDYVNMTFNFETMEFKVEEEIPVIYDI